jgi:VanZ family protein
MTILAWLWSIFVLAACWTPARWFPKTMKPSGPPPWWSIPIPLDKIVHFGLFAVFAFLWAYRPGKPLRTNVPLLAGFAFIALTELGQTIPYIGRSADLDDALADLLGLFAGLLVARLVSPASRREAGEVLMPES